MAPPDGDSRVTILIPIFNDWDAAALLLDDLDRSLDGFPLRPQVLLVNDGSTEPRPQGFAQREFRTLAHVDVLELRRNVGHQRAIAIGLVYLYQNLPCRAVVVMDGDGEDQPSSIPLLAAKFFKQDDRYIVFAARAKRLERFTFRFLYQVYRGVHWILTGDSVRVGNFSMIPFQTLARLAVTPEIWNHYAAAVIRSGVAWTSIPLARGRRIAGQSKMNFIGLLLHGLSAFFVYGEIVGARLLIAIAILMLLGVVVIGGAAGAHFWGSLNVPGLFAYIAGLLGVILCLAVLIALILVFTVIGSRVNVGFLPVRDCPYFVNRLERVFPAHE
jgi:polyisoprenyl-phosphate glycosyltransferase